MITKPRHYQREGAAAVERFGGRALLADEPGLGKTLQAILWHWRNSELWPVVVVCPATLRWNWQAEFLKHFGLDATVLETRRSRKLHGERRLIVNYDILTNRKGEGWLNELMNVRPKVVILDESHYLSNRSTLRTKAVRMLCVGVPHVIALTGTPITKRPVDIWTTLNILRPKTFRSFRAFAEVYNPPQVTPWGITYGAATNTEELHKLLTQTCMIRRRKADVLKELPSLSRCVVPLDMERAGEYRKAEYEFLQWLHDKCPQKARSAARAQQVVKVGYLKRLAAELELKNAVSWVEDFLNTGQKLVLFAIHKNVIQAFAARFKKTCVVVDGSVTGRDRQDAVDRFQNDDRVNLFVGNIKAAGVGITLTAASAVAIVELPWTPADCLQAEKRCDRIGQRNAVTAYYLVARDSLEAKLCTLLQERARTIGEIIDGGDGEDDLNILDLLVDTLRR